jgi:hypothetical protein
MAGRKFIAVTENWAQCFWDRTRRRFPPDQIRLDAWYLNMTGSVTLSPDNEIDV